MTGRANASQMQSLEAVGRIGRRSKVSNATVGTWAATASDNVFVVCQHSSPERIFLGSSPEHGLWTLTEIITQHS
jgi:hypothetical protein